MDPDRSSSDGSKSKGLTPDAPSPDSLSSDGSASNGCSSDGSTNHGPLHGGLDRATQLIETERSQIGHEIHDGLIPLIFAASASVSSLKDRTAPISDDSLQPRLEQINDWLQDALHTARQLLTQIYSPEVAGGRWAVAAKAAIDRLFPDPTFQIHWQVDDDSDDLSDTLAVATYRIVIEAIRNAVAHGGATSIEVAADKRDSQIRVVIRDNGTGFDPASVTPGRFGIRSMRGRAQLVGGALQIDSKPGGPTNVIFTANREQTSQRQ